MVKILVVLLEGETCFNVLQTLVQNYFSTIPEAWLH